MSHDLLTLPQPKTLGEFVRARRMVLGLSQLQLAKLIGGDASKVSRIEAGALEHKLRQSVHKLAKALKVDVQTLIDFVVK